MLTVAGGILIAVTVLALLPVAVFVLTRGFPGESTDARSVEELAQAQAEKRRQELRTLRQIGYFVAACIVFICCLFAYAHGHR